MTLIRAAIWNRSAQQEFIAVRVAVFAEQFFGIETAILPALYNFPYYIGIIILKKLLLIQFDPSHNFQKLMTMEN